MTSATDENGAFGKWSYGIKLGAPYKEGVGGMCNYFIIDFYAAAGINNLQKNVW